MDQIRTPQDEPNSGDVVATPHRSRVRKVGMDIAAVLGVTAAFSAILYGAFKVDAATPLGQYQERLYEGVEHAGHSATTTTADNTSILAAKGPDNQFRLHPALHPELPRHHPSPHPDQPPKFHVPPGSTVTP